MKTEYRRVYNEVQLQRNNINRWEKQLKDAGSLLEKSRSGSPSVNDKSIEPIDP